MKHKHLQILLVCMASKCFTLIVLIRIIKEKNKMAMVSLRQLLDHASEYGYGIPAFNINNMEVLH